MKKLFIALLISTLSFSVNVSASTNNNINNINNINNTNTVKLEVNGLVCAFCANGIIKAFGSKPEVEEVFVSLENKLVVVGFKEGKSISESEIKESLERAGYNLVYVKKSNKTVKEIKAELSK